MVHLRFLPRGSDTYPFDTRILESKGRGLVSPPNRLYNHVIYIRTPNITPTLPRRVSIVICTYGRPESLNGTLDSLTKQTFKDFEVILITEKGNLSELRDKGLRCAVGDIVSFIDDDVYCPPTWLEGVTQCFRKGVVGVSGPTEIPDSYKARRDLWRWPFFLKLHDWLFLEGKESKGGYLSSCGTPSYASSRTKVSLRSWPDQPQENDAIYLEACNMSVLKDEAIQVGGFDTSFTKTSEWCEVDLAIRLLQKGILRYSGRASILHKPSQDGIFKERLQTEHRWKNFIYFQKKWEKKHIKLGLRTYAYRAFIWTYLKLKGLGMI